MGCASSSPEAKETGPPGVAASSATAAARYAVETPAKAAATKGELSAIDSATVQDTLMQVSLLIQKFAEGRNDRTTPVQGLKKALELVITDAQAKFASVQCISEDKDVGLLVAVVGAPDSYLEKYRLQKIGKENLALKKLLSSEQDLLMWDATSGVEGLPVDWQLLSNVVGLQSLSAVAIKVTDRLIGLLTIGFEGAKGRHETSIWPTYQNLVASSMASMMKDNSVPKYLTMANDVHIAPDLDSMAHNALQHFRDVLGHSSNQHVWYRMALTSTNTATATIFDDLNQVPGAAMQRGGGPAGQSLNSSINSSESYKLLKDVQAAGGIMRSYVTMKNTVMKISIHNRQQVMIPDVQKLINQSGNVSTDIFNTRLIKPPTSVLVFPLKVKQNIFGVMFCMSSVQTDFTDVSPRLRELCEVVAPHLLVALTGRLSAEYKNMQAASDTNNNNSNSVSKESIGINGSGIGIGNSVTDQFVFAQSRSSTGALVTGLTEKLNQKRIKSSMEFDGNNALMDLQINHLLGEGGFAKVFRGLWRGLVVGIKVVCDDGKNEKMVMKNAHEIAILTAISHPNIVQAYTCMTDIMVRDMCAVCMRNATTQVLQSPAYQYLMSMDDRPCHLEVIEYCDLGNLSTALKNRVFHHQPTSKLLDCLSTAAMKGQPDMVGVNADNGLSGELRLDMRSLLLTLIEIASAMGELHKMGVVHCDLKPANVLIKTSNNDPRGFMVKVSDFGLSRVEDDDTAASFPFNSCGTAAYVAPEALISNKKVNSTVDVYAYGILMWEMYTAQRPYGNMKQQQLVEEVVMWGLRPKFPEAACPEYVTLAQACWNGMPTSRPNFQEVVSTLNTILETKFDLSPKAGGGAQ